jgi:hypothetical protein
MKPVMGVHTVTSAGTASAVTFTSSRFTITGGTATCTTHLLILDFSLLIIK